MKQSLPTLTFLQRSYFKIFLSRQGPFVVRRLYVCFSHKKVLHHHWFPNGFAFTKMIMWLTKQLTPGKQIHELPKIYQVTLALLLLTLIMTLLATT